MLIRGDHELNEVKVKNFLKATDLELADERTIIEVTGGPLGFSGPVGLKTCNYSRRLCDPRHEIGSGRR